MFRPLILAPILFTLAGCESTSAQFPSLSIREGERIDQGREQAAPAPSTPSAEGTRRIEAIAARIDRASRDFDAAAANARGVVARSGEAGSESWIAAQEALSSLSTSNADLASAINDLDDLSRELVMSAAPSAAAELVAASNLTARAVTIQSAQAEQLTALTAQVAQP